MKTFLVVSFFLFQQSLKAQSVEETKSWILSKLNKYQTEYGFLPEESCKSYPMKSNFKSSFENDTLVISCDVRVIFPKCFNGDKIKATNESAKKLIEKIPISDISKIASLNYGTKFEIDTKLETIKSLAIFPNGNKSESFSSSCMIGLNLNTEENLVERLQKAFTRLSSFYPKKETKDTF